MDTVQELNPIAWPMTAPTCLSTMTWTATVLAGIAAPELFTAPRLGEAAVRELPGPRAPVGGDTAVGDQRLVDRGEDVALHADRGRVDVLQRHLAGARDGGEVGAVLGVPAVQQERPALQGERGDREQGDHAARDDDEDLTALVSPERVSQAVHGRLRVVEPGPTLTFYWFTATSESP